MGMGERFSVVDLVAHPDTDPATAYATQLHLWTAIADRRRRPVLYLYSLADRHVLLGRHHAAPAERDRGLCRRFCGGRVLPFGPGQVGVALMLPTRDAMTDGLPGALSASQVMNRHVRGFLGGCRAAGIDPLYPGRDVVTIDRKIVATLGLDTDARGAAIFEMVVALSRSFDGLAPLLDRVDPAGVLSAGVPNTDQLSDLEGALRRPLSFDEFVGLVSQGFSEQLGARVQAIEVDEADGGAIRRLADDRRGARGWVYGRSLSPEMTKRGSHIGPGGSLDVYFEECDGFLGKVIVSGDFIASTVTVARMESALSGCRLDAEAIDLCISSACSRPGDYMLGVEPPTAVRDAIMRGASL